MCFLFLQAEVEETLKRIQSQKGVQGIIVVNSEGIVSLFPEIITYTTRALQGVVVVLFPAGVSL